MIPAYLHWHLAEHPLLRAQDVVKLVFQAHCGCGHLLAEEASVVARVEQEAYMIRNLHPQPDEPLTEPLGPRYCRLNLQRALGEGIEPLWIARMMALSTLPANDQAERRAAYELLSQLSAEELNVDAEELEALAELLIDDPVYLPGHSEDYRQAYHPAYRVISREMARLLPVLSAIARAQQEHPQVLLCLDGPCGSGKSTMAAQLVRITDAACVPMDDFYTPHAKKTPERLAQPGGNADVERLLGEFLLPWSRNGSGSYCPYLCSERRFGSPIFVPENPLTILEGSYSLHPDIAAHADIKVFLTIDEEEQLRRLRAREGDLGLQMFQQRWIPLERAYHEAFSLPDASCLVIAPQRLTDV